MAVQIPFPLPSTGFALNSKVRINLDFLVGQFNQFNTGTATWDTVGVGVANSETGTLTFWNSANAHYLTFQAGATAANTTFTWPTGMPSADRKFLTSTTGGVMSWSALSAAASYAGNQLLYIDASDVIQELAVGSGNKVLVNSTPPSFSSLLGTTNQVVVTPGTGNYTFSLPQDIGTASSVQFGSLQVAGGSATNPGVRVIYSGAATNTGIWSASGTELDFTVAGATRLALDSTGLAVATGEFRAPVVQATTALELVTAAGPRLTMQTVTSGGTAYTITWPSAVGASNTVLSTDASGNLSWVSISSVGGASNALDNLASVAVNASLTPGADNSIDLGSALKQWKNLFIGTDATIAGVVSAATATAAVFKDSASSPADAGTVRLANGATINWRNNAGLGNIGITTTSGDVFLFGAPIQTTTETLTATSNQLVLGSTRTVTVTAPTPATSSRTVTIPDLSASYSVVGTEGAQTVNGNKTLSGTTNLSALTASLPLQLDASKNIVSTAIDLATSQITGNLGVAHLNGGTSASSSTFWCGDGTWKGVSAAGGATQALDNLASTAVNASIIPASANSVDLGSIAKPWLNAYSGLLQLGYNGFLGYFSMFPGTLNKGSFVIVPVDNSGDYVTTLTYAAQGAARTYTIPDAGASASFVMTEGTQTINGAKTMGADFNVNAGTTSNLYVTSTSVGGVQVRVLAATTSAGYIQTQTNHPLYFTTNNGTNALEITTGQYCNVRGTTTNNDAAAGFVGEAVTSTGSAVSAATSGQYGDLTSISLTAGDWLVYGTSMLVMNGATFTAQSRTGIGTASGDNTAGTSLGYSLMYANTPTGTGGDTTSNSIVGPVRVSLASTTTIYFKTYASYTGGPPQWYGTIYAIRVR